MSKRLKRFLYYWRLPLFFFVLGIILMGLAFILDPDSDAYIAAGVIWLFIDIPCLIFFTIRSIYLYIRSIITYRRTGIRDESLVFPEINLARGIIDAVSEEFDSLRALPFNMQLRCILFRLLGVVLIVGGSIGAFFFSFSYFFLIIFTLVIIAGATLWIVANPQRYNERISGSSMVPCGDDITNEQLYKILCTLPTPLGTPHLAKVRGFKKPIIVYGSQSDTYIYLVYHARTFDFFYVSTIYSFSLLQILPDDNVRSDEEAADSINQEFAYYLYTITSTVEKAVSLAGRE